MNTSGFRLALSLLLFCGIAHRTALTAADAVSGTSSPSESRPMFTYVVLHGAWGGGWAFKDLERRLRADGHTVYRPTLTGQGERVHLANPEIDLSLHIQDVVNVILWEDLHEVVLVGHSYGGMVVTGVADRIPERIKYLIYLDAFLPENGESVDDLFSRRFPVIDGFVIPSWLKKDAPPPDNVPHPAKTFAEPIALHNQDAAEKIPTSYILTVDPGKQAEEDVFFKFFERARARGWVTSTMECDHNPQWSKLDELVTRLEAAPLARRDP